MSKSAKRSLYLVGFLIILYILQQVGLLNGIISYLGALPFWVILVMTGILVSFWQFMKHSEDGEEEDEKWIEEQGMVYINRMLDEKERRKKDRPSSQI